MILRMIAASALALLWSVLYTSALSAKAAMPVVVKSRPITCGETCAERFGYGGPGYRRCVGNAVADIEALAPLELRLQIANRCFRQVGHAHGRWWFSGRHDPRWLRPV